MILFDCWQKVDINRKVYLYNFIRLLEKGLPIRYCSTVDKRFTSRKVYLYNFMRLIEIGLPIRYCSTVDKRFTYPERLTLTNAYMKSFIYIIK